MAKFRKNSKFRFSSDERRAYWVGVGISAERYGDSDKLFDSSNSSLRRSLINGFNDDNHNDLSGKLMKPKK